MKECPRCRLLYADENLRFCRFDGSSLIRAGTPADEVATILFPTGRLNDRFKPLEELRRGSQSKELS